MGSECQVVVLQSLLSRRKVILTLILLMWLWIGSHQDTRLRGGMTTRSFKKGSHKGVFRRALQKLFRRVLGKGFSERCFGKVFLHPFDE